MINRSQSWCEVKREHLLSDATKSYRRDRQRDRMERLLAPYMLPETIVHVGQVDAKARSGKGNTANLSVSS